MREATVSYGEIFKGKGIQLELDANTLSSPIDLLGVFKDPASMISMQTANGNHLFAPHH